MQHVEFLQHTVTLAIILGAVIGVALGTLGAGASILAIPVLVHLAGESVRDATATSLVAVGIAAAVAAVGHARAQRVDWSAAATFVALGAPGTWVGVLANAHLNPNVLLLAFSALMLLAAHRMLTACPTCTRAGEERALRMGSGNALFSRRSMRDSGAVLLAATTVGLLSGLFGIGGGFVAIPALTLALKLTVPRAIGTSLVIIAGNAAFALLLRGAHTVDWSIAWPFAAAMLVGSAIGAATAARLAPKQSLRIFAGLLVVLAMGNGAIAGWELWS